MTESGWMRFTPHAVFGATLFLLMHMAEDLVLGGAPTDDPTLVAIIIGIVVLLGMWSLWWVVTDRPWGYLVAVLLGLLAFQAAISHFTALDLEGMFSWGVVFLQLVFSVGVIVLGVNGLRLYKPWQRGENTNP